jgi:hypothetical protein
MRRLQNFESTNSQHIESRIENNHIVSSHPIGETNNHPNSNAYATASCWMRHYPPLEPGDLCGACDRIDPSYYAPAAPSLPSLRPPADRPRLRLYPPARAACSLGSSSMLGARDRVRRREGNQDEGPDWIGWGSLSSGVARKQQRRGGAGQGRTEERGEEKRETSTGSSALEIWTRGA